MFYSQTFLARKGPLGTVWCAAHLQSRLKKSHYTSTDIPSTVDRIMFPDVPIALRMSGHLLFGVVRIYSKQVDYLYQDCNVVLTTLRKTFASIDLNLPENAMQAPVQSITLPETFDLDALDLDGGVFGEGAYDNHHASQEDITLPDQIPIATDRYVTITFDEDIQNEVFGSDVAPMDEDIHSTTPGEGVPSDRFTPPNKEAGVIQDALPDNSSLQYVQPTEVLQDDAHLPDDGSPQHVQPMEVMRDAVPPEIVPMVALNNGNDLTEPDKSINPEMNEKEVLSPITEENTPGGPSPLSLPSSGPRASVASLPEMNEKDVSFQMQSTPHVEQPRARARKRKQYFDETLVLSNEFMNRTIQDASDLKRKKRNIAYSTLGVWKLNNSLRKEQIFFQPSLTGLCSDLRNIFDKDYISKQSHLVEGALPVSGSATSPPTTEFSLERGVPPSLPVIEVSTEFNGAESPPTIERFQHVEEHDGGNNLPEHEGAQSPPQIERFQHAEEHDGGNNLPEYEGAQSPTTHYDFIPAPSPNLMSASVPPLEASTGTQILLTPDQTASTRFHESVNETPKTMFEEWVGLENTGLSNNPEFNNSAEAGLFFLEADGNTPAGSQATQGIPGSQGTQGVDSLSVRTRAVAQFLKRESSISSISEDVTGDLSLDKILEGKTRKLCARMFYETLVLKTYGLVDVKQEVPYGDIILTLNQTLSKAQI
ncbi:hypothetical protein TB2_028200 [Malus domestica]|uniref:sister chromatid cohesion 1 protein 3-like isoform X1 n=1 Tax=Malus domestica TaxID=3750 RepID=UPI003975DDBF